MKVTLFFLYLFFLLPSGNPTLFANAQHKKNSVSSNQHFAKNQQNSFSNNDQTISLIEETDIDLEEDSHNGTSSKTQSNKNFLVSKNNFLSNWNRQEATLFTSIKHARYTFFAPICRNSNPIYITLLDLRI
jgi:hypothetical protein